ncbi:tumor protein p63-regulated gene 1-like protein [Anabrus simplex]|uniref:tumor protein p63-regulated gene 1-like protein n=1 Tax=Anabrus simplex TaxID=316456 RepID=UPI0034DDA085
MAFAKDYDVNAESLLEEGPAVDFQGSKLYIRAEGSRTPSSLDDECECSAKLLVSPECAVLPLSPTVKNYSDEETLAPVVSGGDDIVSPVSPSRARDCRSERSIQGKGRSDSKVICPKKIIAMEDAKDFFTYRDSIVETAVTECINSLISPETDGDFLGAWLITEISLWDNDKERLILLSAHSLTTVKYDFIALKQLEHRKIALEEIDTLIIGDLVYPTGSLVPRLSGLATGVVTVVKGCLLKPLQERWTRNSPIDKDFCASSFDFNNFEPRSRNMRGLRALWNRGEDLPFSKKWNPFNKDIPFVTYTSHPLIWHKDVKSKYMYDVEDFTRKLVSAVEHAQETSASTTPVHCRVEHKPIILHNYIGLSSIIHNRNSLGFFKVRGKFSF